MKYFIDADAGDRRYWFLVLTRVIPNATFVHNGRRLQLFIDDNLENASLIITHLPTAEAKEETYDFMLYVQHRPDPRTVLECYKRNDKSIIQYTLDFDSFIFCVIEWAQRTNNLAVEFLLRSYYRAEENYTYIN